MKFDSVIFDLDGVITQTALVHSAAWGHMFNEYLKVRETRDGEPFRAFTHADDYLPHVDGKPRYKGVNDFLASRNISIPYGDPADPPDRETVCSLGNRKDAAFNEILSRDGVAVYPSTVQFINDLLAAGVKIGVASSSKNCGPVLERAGLADRFGTRVDGVVSAQMGLKGKPEPDIFTVAAGNLHAVPERSVVIEDAVSGVQAGKAGNFGLVIGVAREENEHALWEAGADWVVRDLEEVSLPRINQWFEAGLHEDAWGITYHTYEPKKERTREALLATGNGYMGTRGTLAETAANPVNYPGTYVAGLYNRLFSEAGDRQIENEDFVNVPNWLSIQWCVDDGEWMDINHAEIAGITRHLDFTTGEYTRTMTVRDAGGRETKIETGHFVSMADPHKAAQYYRLTPVNYAGVLKVRSGIDGDLINDGVDRYRQLNQQHLEPVEAGDEDDMIWVTVKTVQSNVRIAEAAVHQVTLNHRAVAGNLYETEIGESFVYVTYLQEVNPGETFGVEKHVAVFTSKPDDSAEPLQAARESVRQIAGYSELLNASREAWAAIWKRIDIRITGSRTDQKLLRLHLYHMMVSASPHNRTIDASFTARGLHGEAYRGHIFWDELFILPFYSMQYPETARATLMYRYRRLDAARAYAREHGYQGAMFPWQSGSDGREETQVVHLNPLTGEWGDDYSSLQRHVSLAIAYNIWEYFHISGDIEFLRHYGAEMFLEICRFWISKTTDKGNGKYSIEGVMGPDEFHEQYHGADKGGLKDNAYTNLMVAWALRKVNEILKVLGDGAAVVLDKTGIAQNELQQWENVAKNLNIPISEDGIIAQYDGYFDLKELDWDHYRKTYGNIYRLDRILKAEDKSADEYKVAKQADALMVFYNLEAEEVTGILQEMGYSLPEDYLKRNLEYYLARTSHGSTLSRIVHAELASMVGDRKLSWELYRDALGSDFNDIQGGTTGEGIHFGVMAGTVLIAMQTFAGLDLRGKKIKINPNLPDAWKSIAFTFGFRNARYFLETDRSQLTLKLLEGESAEVIVRGKAYMLSLNEPIIIQLS